MLKPIAITLPEKMIEQIDDMLLEKDFASRSDFFRHLIRMWFMNCKSKSCENSGQEEADEAEDVDYEFGIPPAEIEKIKLKAKLLN
jgi:Arc/MetJ-type ribon-helix-helix transcriptional regulator